MTTLRTVPIASIKLDPRVRNDIDEESLRALAISVAAVGLQQPPLCHQGRGGLRLIDGERRLRACEMLGWTTITVLVLDGRIDDAESLARRLASNLQRGRLNPVEQAEGIRTLMALGALTAAAAGKLLGIPESAVTRSLGILKLPEAVRRRVSSGEISADAAYQLSRVEDPAALAALAEEVAAKRAARAGPGRTRKRRQAKPGEHARLTHARVVGGRRARRATRPCSVK